MKVLGIDIGGTNTELAVMCTTNGVVESVSFKTKSVSSFSAYIYKLSEFVKQLTLNHTILGIGIGAPNYHAQRKEFMPVNFLWDDVTPFNLQLHFETMFNLPCSVVNDANAIALAENKYGAGKKYKSFVLLTLGTGLGCGIVLNNQLFEGASGYAGEFGHLKIEGLDRLCNCGGIGCLETLVSTAGLLTSYTNLGNKLEDNYTVKEIFEKANLKDESCLSVLDLTFSNLGRKLSDLIHILNPEAIIFGGNISKSLHPFMAQISAACEHNLMSDFKGSINYEVSNLLTKKVNLLGSCSLALLKLETIGNS